ncbi:MAG: hypothetical protein HY363_04085 [Candidatus Aenigmarchaeota archaeon]|nr:hypothetical protein [Candidatus Aenigmarchaeota archaeon]
MNVSQETNTKKLLTELLDNARKNEKKHRIDCIEETVDVKTEITEGEAIGKAYSSAGRQTIYAVAENYGGSTSTQSKVHYVRCKIEKYDDCKKEAAAEMVHSPVVENLIETQRAGVAAQVNGRIKNEFGSAVVTPTQDLYEKERVETFKRTNKAFNEFIYATCGLVDWFI